MIIDRSIPYSDLNGVVTYINISVCGCWQRFLYLVIMPGWLCSLGVIELYLISYLTVLALYVSSFASTAVKRLWQDNCHVCLTAWAINFPMRCVFSTTIYDTLTGDAVDGHTSIFWHRLRPVIAASNEFSISYLYSTGGITGDHSRMKRAGIS